MAEAGTVRVKVTADVNSFTRNMNRVQGTLSRVGRRVGAAAKAWRGYGLALTAAAVGIAVLIKKVANAVDKIAKLSERVNVSVQTLSAYKLVSELAGTSLDGFAKSQQKLARAALESNQGLETYARAFRDLGIDVTDTSGRVKASEVLFLEIADAFSKMADGSRKTGIAMQIMGRSGVEMINLLNQGSVAIKEQIEQARLLGISFDEVSAKKAVEFNDALTRLSGTIGGILRDAVIELLPEITRLVDSLTLAAERAEVQGIPRYEALGRALGVAIMDGMISALNPVRLGKALFELSKSQLENATLFVVDKISGPERVAELLNEKVMAGLDVFRQQALRDFDLSQFTAEFDAFSAVVDRAAVSVAQITMPMRQFEKATNDSRAAWAGLGRELTVDLSKNVKDLSALTAEFEKQRTLSRVGPEGLARVELEKKIASMQLVVNAGRASQAELDKVAQSMRKGLQDTTTVAQESFEEMNTFAVQAAANMEDAFSTLFFDVMTGQFKGFMGLLQEVERAIAKLIANLIAQDLAGALFGKNFGSTGKAGGLLGGLAGALGLGGFKGLAFGGFGSASGGSASLSSQLVIPQDPGRALGVPAFAEGGFVNKPTLAVVGEAGPEAIIPINKIQKVRRDESRGGQTIVNFNINAIDSRSFRAFAFENMDAFVDVIETARLDNHPMRRSV